ncbi:MAG: DUF1801 domain-containing protein [Gemmatimonadaceae bacterium]
MTRSSRAHSKSPNADVARVFAGYPADVRKKLLEMRAFILQTATATDGVGPLEETLKWGEPSYLTSESKSGSTIRIAWKKSTPSQYAMYFNCQTTLVDSFRFQFPNDFEFEGNRALVFDVADEVPVDALRHCVAAALTYHRSK